LEKKKEGFFIEKQAEILPGEDPEFDELIAGMEGDNPEKLKEKVKEQTKVSNKGISCILNQWLSV